MPIQNKQLENNPRKFPAGTTPSTLTGEGAFFVKLVGGVAEGHYVDDQGREIRITNGGALNASGSGETNTASNLSGGTGIFAQKVASDLQFKSLVAGTNVSITNNSNTITISATGGSGETNTASNLGAGSGVFAQKVSSDLQFKSLVAGSNISITSAANTLTIASTGGSGESNTASNLGTGTGLFSAKSGIDLRFKSLVAGTNVTLSSDANTVTINAAGGGSSTVQGFRFTLPQTGSTLASRLAGAIGLPSGWTLATADTAGETQFGSDVDTLVITWNPTIGTKIAKCSVWQINTSGPASTQGIQKIDIGTAADEKTKTDKTKAAIFLTGKGLQTTRDLEVLVELV